MRIKHNPVIKETQTQKKYEMQFLANSLHPGNEMPDELALPTEAATVQESSLQKTADKILEPTNTKVNKKVSNESSKKISEKLEQITKAEKLLKNKSTKEIDCATKVKETVDAVIVSAKPTTLADKLKIILPKRQNSNVDDKNNKPSASIEPFNYVKFETATGETFYFSKYFKLPPNLPPRKSSNPNKRKRIRTAFTDAHLRKLEQEFNKNRFINAAQRKSIAQSLNLTEKSVKVWYQNRRIKERRELLGDDSDDEVTVKAENVRIPHERVTRQNPESSQTLISTFYHSSNEDASTKILKNDSICVKRRRDIDSNDDSSDNDDVCIVEQESCDVKKEKQDTDGKDDSVCKKKRLVSNLFFEDE